MTKKLIQKIIGRISEEKIERYVTATLQWNEMEIREVGGKVD